MAAKSFILGTGSHEFPGCPCKGEEKKRYVSQIIEIVLRVVLGFGFFRDDAVPVS